MLCLVGNGQRTTPRRALGRFVPPLLPFMHMFLRWLLLHGHFANPWAAPPTAWTDRRVGMVPGVTAELCLLCAGFAFALALHPGTAWPQVAPTPISTLVLTMVAIRSPCYFHCSSFLRLSPFCFEHAPIVVSHSPMSVASRAFFPPTNIPLSSQCPDSGWCKIPEKLEFCALDSESNYTPSIKPLKESQKSGNPPGL